MKQLRKIKTKINTILIDKTYAYADEIKKINAKKHFRTSKELIKDNSRVVALRGLISDLLQLRQLINSYLDNYIYEGIIK